MSLHGSNREKIFTIYLKDFYEEWERLFGFRIEDLYHERYYAGKKIDLMGYDPKRRIGIYFEIQITKANKSYLERIKEMIERRHPEGVIVWIASSFDDELLDELAEWLKQGHRKYIDFYAVTINPVALDTLKELNKMYHLEVYDNLLPLLGKIKDILRLCYEHRQLNQAHCGSFHIKRPHLDLSRPEDVNYALLLKLRNEIRNFLNFHNEIKTPQNSYIITFCAGKSGISFRSSTKKGSYFVELDFHHSMIDWFNAFQNRGLEIKEKVHPKIEFREGKKIGVYFESEGSLDEIFNEIVGIYKSMIDYFCEFTYGDKSPY